MKKYSKEKIILLIQLFMFYVFPLFAGPTDVIGMVILIIFATFLLSAVLGVISSSKLKFLYPLVTAIVFLPTILIYYNESALVHSLWYLVVSSAGLVLGLIVKLIFHLLKKLFK